MLYNCNWCRYYVCIGWRVVIISEQNNRNSLRLILSVYRCIHGSSFVQQIVYEIQIGEQTNIRKRQNECIFAGDTRSYSRNLDDKAACMSGWSWCNKLCLYSVCHANQIEHFPANDNFPQQNLKKFPCWRKNESVFNKQCQNIALHNIVCSHNNVIRYSLRGICHTFFLINSHSSISYRCMWMFLCLCECFWHAHRMAYTYIIYALNRNMTVVSAQQFTIV